MNQHNGKDKIAKLCNYYAKNIESYASDGVKEAQVRLGLIDPFFEALGWDVQNRNLVAPQYREVVPEENLRVDGTQRAPDYAFRIGTQIKFFAEAKKCSAKLASDALHAYQLRRYGWSGKTPVSLLTNFAELSAFDCTRKPVQADKASTSRLLYLTYEQYADRWGEIWAVYSREAVWSGGFDAFAATKKRRGTDEVDAEFLKEIEGWREALAKNIALRNRSLSPDEINATVQLTIDRIIFLRMAEDRGLERFQQLLAVANQPDAYQRFVGDICRKADDKYNSGLFHFRSEPGTKEPPDTVSPTLQVDDKVFRPILRGLYLEHGSPYDFGVIPVEILGTVYERFLGKVIRLTTWIATR